MIVVFLDYYFVGTLKQEYIILCILWYFSRVYCSEFVVLFLKEKHWCNKLLKTKVAVTQ